MDRISVALSFEVLKANEKSLGVDGTATKAEIDERSKQRQKRHSMCLYAQADGKSNT